jgi:dTDP-glucose 4,6-dehydratase
METVLVTGGAGFIGSSFVRHVLERTAARVVVLDKLTYAGSLLNLEGLDPGRVAFVRGDIADRETVRRTFAGHRPDAVVNFAAETHVDRSIDDPLPVIATNTLGVFELLEAARFHVREIDAEAAARFRFLQVSTDEVYGSLGPAGAFSETTAYAPNSPYAASKAGADHLVRAWHHTFGVPVLLTNCSNNYGPRQFPEKLIPLMILNALEGRPLPIYGDGGNVRDWLYVADHCEAILAVLDRGRPGEHYNIGGEGERTNLQIVDAICGLLEQLVPAAGNPALAQRGVAGYRDLRAFVADRPGHDRRYAIDAAKIRAELGWRPRHGLDAGMAATVRWYVENRDWCAAVQHGNYDRERLGLAGRDPGGTSK